MELRGERHRLFQPFTDKRGVAKPGLSWTNLPLKESDSLPGFCKIFGVSDAEWEAARAAWPGSERARRYGLADSTQRKGFSVDLGKVSARAKESNAKRRQGRKQG